MLENKKNKNVKNAIVAVPITIYNILVPYPSKLSVLFQVNTKYAINTINIVEPGIHKRLLDAYKS